MIKVAATFTINLTKCSPCSLLTSSLILIRSCMLRLQYHAWELQGHSVITNISKVTNNFVENRLIPKIILHVSNISTQTLDFNNRIKCFNFFHTTIKLSGVLQCCSEKNKNKKQKQTNKQKKKKKKKTHWGQIFQSVTSFETNFFNFFFLALCFGFAACRFHFKSHCNWSVCVVLWFIYPKIIG